MRACRPLLGTYVEISIEAQPQASVEAAIHAAFAAIERVQELMSAHDPDSDVSHINREAHLRPVLVDRWTYEVLAEALIIHQLSGGLFDCAVGHRLAEWGLLPAELFKLNSSATGQPTLAQMELLDDGCVRTTAPLGLDLGGIAKGFAVDKAIEVLRQHGIDDAIVNAGGDLRVMGAQVAPIHVRDPRNPRRLHHAGNLNDGAFATSGSYYSRHEASSPDVSALVIPGSGQAVIDIRSYSVAAPRCMHADALTKVLAVSGDPHLSCFAHFAAYPVIL